MTEPNQVWVTDITYIRTHEGWLYLAIVIDLFSRLVIGGSMQPRMDRELALNTLLMAVWRRQPQETVTVHSDQGSQDIFNYIEMVYNPVRRHSYSNHLSPVNYEKRYFERLAGV